MQRGVIDVSARGGREGGKDETKTGAKCSLGWLRGYRHGQSINRPLPNQGSFPSPIIKFSPRPARD